MRKVFHIRSWLRYLDKREPNTKSIEFFNRIKKIFIDKLNIIIVIIKIRL